MKTLIYSSHKYEKPYLEEANKNKHQFIFTKKSLNKETINLAKGFDAISIFSADDASENILESLFKLGVKYIALCMAGFDNVDLKKCHALKIKVANVPKYSPFSVAQHAVLLALCLNRKIKLLQNLIKKNDFRLDQLVGFDMKNKTVGIIGAGNIGTVFAKIMHGFGCKLLAYDLKENEILKKEIGIKYVTLDQLCTQSDIISLHCPLNESTKYLLNKDKFALMKKEALVVNTSRGAVINTKDLLKAVENKKIAGAALDVYEFEKNLFFNKHAKINDKLFKTLHKKENVIITGHQAFLTAEALTNIANTVIHNIDCWGKGESSSNEI